MRSRHRDNKGKDVVDERIESLVHERSPGQGCDRLELVVDEQLRQHEQESKGINSVYHTVDGPRIPTAIGKAHIFYNSSS